jgi:hypothetical protein
MEWAFFLIVAVFLVIIAVASQYRKGLRQTMWHGVADSYRFQYFPEDPHGLPERHEFALFQEGRSKRAYNCVEGDYEKLPVIVFDYEYKTGSGKNTHTHNLSALMCRLKICCPYLMIRPETIIDRFAAFLGFSQIQFESDEFNRAFNVKGEDKKFAYDICHPQMMEFLLQNRDWTLEFRGGYLVLYHPDKEFEQADVPRVLAMAAELVSRIPTYLEDEAKP